MKKRDVTGALISSLIQPMKITKILITSVKLTICSRWVPIFNCQGVFIWILHKQLKMLLQLHHILYVNFLPEKAVYPLYGAFNQNTCNNSIYIRVCKYMDDVRSASREAWQDHAHFLFRKLNYYKKTNEYYSMIPFASSRLWSKRFFF